MINIKNKILILASFLGILILGVIFFKTLFPLPRQPSAGGPLVPGDVAWMLTATGLVLFMTPGLSFFYGGMVQRKNMISTMLQSYAAMGLVSILWVVLGFSLSFGESIHGLIGNPLSFFMFHGVGDQTTAELSPTIPFALFALFQLKFAIITPALITGAFAERIRFSSYLLFTCLFSLFIYAPIAHWTWHPKGILHQLGVLDFAGGTVVHVSAGFAALAGALAVGRRKTHLRNLVHFPANIPYVLLGTGMLWFGWFGFNAGSALAANATAVSALLTTNMAASSAMMTWMLMEWLQDRRPSAVGACVGAVVGLVAITPAAGFVSVAASLFIGSFASLASHLALRLKSTFKVDDTLDVFGCHGVGGVVGMILTGVFAKSEGLLFGSPKLFFLQLFALVMVGIFSFLGAYLLFGLTNWVIPLRVLHEEEELGLDLSQHHESMGEESIPEALEGIY